MNNLEQADFLSEDGSKVIIDNSEKPEEDVPAEETKEEEKLTDAERRRRHIEEVKRKGTDIEDDRTPFEELIG